MRGRRQPLLEAALVGSAFGLAFLYSLRRLSDSDLWHHLKCGEYLFEHGAILKTLYFNCSRPDDPFLNHEWLFQAVVYSIHAGGGEGGLVVLQILLVLLACFLLYRTLRLHSDDRGIIALVLALGVLASSHRFALRPQHFSYVFLAYFLFSLHEYQRGKRAYFYVTPALMVIWVNLHAESLWGLVIPALFLAVELVTARAERDRRYFAPIGWVLALTAVASLANPFTYRTVLWPLIVMSEMGGGVEELLAPTSPRFAFFWVYFALFVASVAARPRATRPTWLVLSGLFAAVAWSANRGIPHFVFVSAPVVTAGLTHRLGPILGRARPGVSLSLRIGLLAALGAIAVLVLMSPNYLQKYDAVPYPDGAVRFLQSTGTEGHVFNEHLWGGFLIWKGYPQLKPYIDGRFHQRDFYRRYLSALAGRPGWQSELSRYGITVAILRYSPSAQPRLNDVLFSTPRWRLVHWDDVSLVYLKDVEAHREVIAGYANDVVNPDRQLLFQYQSARPELTRRAAAVTERNLRFAGRSYRALILAANAHFGLGDYETAARRYEAALEHLELPNAWVYFQIARCHRRRKDLAQAEIYLRRCLALAPDFEEGQRMLLEIGSLRAGAR